MSICPMCEKKWSGWGRASLDTREYFQRRGIHLTDNEGRVVAALVKNGRPLSRANLFDVLWGDDVDGGPELADNCLKVCVSKLRKKINGIPFGIETIWGRGYVAKNIKSLDGFPPLNVMAYAVLIPLLLSFPIAAVAQAFCADPPALSAGLAKQFNEYRVSAAMTAEQKLLERYENPVTGAWTLVVYENGHKACVVAAGTEWYEKKVNNDPGA